MAILDDTDKLTKDLLVNRARELGLSMDEVSKALKQFDDAMKAAPSKFVFSTSLSVRNPRAVGRITSDDGDILLIPQKKIAGMDIDDAVVDETTTLKPADWKGLHAGTRPAFWNAFEDEERRKAMNARWQDIEAKIVENRPERSVSPDCPTGDNPDRGTW